MKRLTPEQLDACHFPSGAPAGPRHLAVEAGAGTGKTAVIAARVRWLLFDAPQSYRIPPARLVLVTFTRAAERELRNRIEREIAPIPGGFEALSLLHISTIDSLFSRLFETTYSSWRDAELKNLPRPPPGILPERADPMDPALLAPACAERLVAWVDGLCERNAAGSMNLDFLLSGAFDGLPERARDASRSRSFGRSTGRKLVELFFTERMLSPRLVQRLLLASPEVHACARPFLAGLRDEALAAFQDRLYRGALTHTDRTVFLARVLLSEDGAAAVPLPLAPLELIVDEYQDTSLLQHLLLKRLVDGHGASNPERGRMVVVGDPKQGIYGFRQASVEVFLSLLRDPEWHSVRLSRSFRSDPDLVEQCNILSDLAFAYIPPEWDELPEADPLRPAAARARVPAGALAPGRERDPRWALPDGIPRVMVLSASLNDKRSPEFKPKPKEVRLASMLHWALARYLKELCGAGAPFRYRDVAILTERNKDAAALRDALARAGLPARLATARGSAGGKAGCPARETALALLRALQGEFTAIDALHLHLSPVVGGAPDEALRAFAILRENEISDPLRASLQLASLESDPLRTALSSCPKILATWERIGRACGIAGEFFYAAWQTLRWDLVESVGKDEAAWNAAQRMDPFAEKLASFTDLEHVRAQAELCARANRLESEVDTETAPVSPFPWSADAWPSADDDGGESVHLPPHLSDDAVTVTTVHQAKGLEWPCVVFAPRYDRAGGDEAEFSTAYEGGTLYLNWMAGDMRALSVLPRIPNPQLKAGADVVAAARIESQFERQRILYTAFTRAREHLVLLPPSPSAVTKAGLRDELAKLKLGDAGNLPEEGKRKLVPDVLLRYLCKNFDLGKPGGKKETPREPWAGREPDAVPRAPGLRSVVGFRDYGPAWYDTFAQEFLGGAALNESAASKEGSAEDGAAQDGDAVPRENTAPDATVVNPFSSTILPSGLISSPPLSWSLETSPLPPNSRRGHRPRPQAQSTDAEVIADAERNTDAEAEALPQKPLSRRQKVALGLQYHAAMENAPEDARAQGLLGALRADAFRMFHEFELWSDAGRPSDGAGRTLFPLRLASPSRMVADLVSLYEHGRLPAFLEDATWTAAAGGESSLSAFCAAHPGPLALVIDFKTGSPQPEHGTQLARYQQSVGRWLASPWGERLLPLAAGHAWSVLGLLCYDQLRTGSRQGQRTVLGRYTLELHPPPAAPTTDTSAR